jgi:hypothetical protein
MPTKLPPISSESTALRQHWVEILIGALLLAIGIAQLHWQVKWGDVISDAYYIELGNSIAAHRPYGFDFKVETLIPPGFPLIIAGIYAVFGHAQIFLARSMTVFFILGLGANYLLIRREAGQAAAAAIVLLLGSSPDIFAFSTQVVFSEFPYLLASTLALILGVKLAEAQGMGRTVILGCALTIALISATLIRSSGMALILAIPPWAFISFWRGGSPALARFRRFGIPFILAAAVQGGWMSWSATHEVHEWPVGGWPGSYVSQLTLKSGNEPDLGHATLKDIGPLLSKNLVDYGEMLARFPLHREWKRAWYSPIVLGAILLAITGVIGTFWRTGGGFVDWYFLGYLAMYLLWPWEIELRFAIPIAPLACLYFWRGAQIVISQHVRTRVLTTACAVSVASAFLAKVANREHVVYLVFWTATGLLCGAMAIASSRGHDLAGRLGSLCPKPIRVAGSIVVLVALVVSGLGLQRTMAQSLQNAPLSDAFNFPDIESGQWIRDHVPENGVVMARKLDLVYHYSHRRVIWFPPTDRAEVLMDGIRKYNVGWVAVSAKPYWYWRPGETECFSALQARFPSSFRLVHKGLRDWIYVVEPESNRVEQGK